MAGLAGRPHEWQLGFGLLEFEPAGQSMSSLVTFALTKPVMGKSGSEIRRQLTHFLVA
jgi:hypothetical protein